MITKKSLRVLGNSVNYFVRGEICNPSYMACKFESIEELTDILKNFDTAEICPGFTVKELGVTNCLSIEGVKNPNNIRYKACEMLVVDGQLKCSSCKYFDVLSRRKVARVCSQKNCRYQERK